MLPIPVIFALLRILKGRLADPDDEDVLFDEYGCVGEERTLRVAASRLGIENTELGNRPGERGYWRTALECCLIDMLRQHKRLRDERRMAA